MIGAMPPPIAVTGAKFAQGIGSRADAGRNARAVAFLLPSTSLSCAEELVSVTLPACRW
jgi:hypothetical protein